MAFEIVKTISINNDNPHYLSWWNHLIRGATLILREAKDDESLTDALFVLHSAINKNASFRTTPHLGTAFVDAGTIELLLLKVRKEKIGKREKQKARVIRKEEPE